VIRVSPATRAQARAGRDGWSVSVAFVDLPAAVQQAIPRFYNSLLGAGRRGGR
jgi:hypothetical protein